MKKQIFAIVIFCIVSTISLIHAQTSPDCKSLYPFSSGKNKPGKQKMGYINSSGKVVVPPQFDFAEEFSEGMGRIQIDYNSGYVNSEGKLVIEPKFGNGGKFSNGLARVQYFGENENGWGYINKSGELVIRFPNPAEGESQPTILLSDTLPPVSDFSDGTAVIETVDGQVYIDKTGKVAIKEIFDDATNFENGIAVVGLKNQYWIINKKGERITKLPYAFSGFAEGLAISEIQNTYRFIDKRGTAILEVNYDDVRHFSEGMAAIRLNNKWGFINKKGEIVISPRYEDIVDFSEGLAAIKFAGKYGFINNSGEFVISPKLEHVYSPFKCGLAYVHGNGFEGYINKRGKWVWKQKVSP